MAGALRKDELLKLQKNDVQDLGSKFLVTIRASKTKTNRIFTIVDNEHKTLLNIVRHYISLRPSDMPHQRFFIFCKNNKCSTQPIGINTFSKLPSDIAKFLKLEQPHLYTGHCFRRSSASILSDAGADFAAIKRHGGWRSTAVAEGYIENSIQNKINIAEKILSVVPQTSTSSTDSTDTAVTTENMQTLTQTEKDVNVTLNSQLNRTDNNLSTPLFNFNNCSGNTINIHIHQCKENTD